MPFIKVVLKENFTLSSRIPRLTDLINFIVCHSQLKGGEMQSFKWKFDFFAWKIKTKKFITQTSKAASLWNRGWGKRKNQTGSNQLEVTHTEKEIGESALFFILDRQYKVFREIPLMKWILRLF